MVKSWMVEVELSDEELQALRKLVENITQPNLQIDLNSYVDVLKLWDGLEKVLAAAQPTGDQPAESATG